MPHAIQSSRLFPFVLLALTSLCAAPVSAQNEGATGVFVAIPETFPDVDARALIIRERGRDVILLRSSEATPEALAMSMVALRRVRVDHPAPEHGQMIPIAGFARTRPLPEEYKDELEALLARLALRPTTDVGNLGPGRWVRYVGR